MKKALATIGAVLAGAVFAGYRGPPMPLDKRADEGEVAAPGQYRLESTYASVSVAWGAPEEFADGVTMSYRKAGEAKWREALAPEFYAPWKNYRGSIVNLAEDTEYEVRIEAAGKTQTAGKVRTWATKVPIAKTVEIDPATAAFPIVLGDQTAGDGWTRYVPKGGRPLVNRTDKETFRIDGARHVILDGFTIVGGRGFSAIRVDKSEGVRILNCEISGWGPAGVGAPNAAIYLADFPHEVTVERCFVHSPNGRAQSWRYSHPYGPQALRVHKPYSTVVRWCDFIGSDSRRFDDVVKCDGNSGYHHGFNRNADIQGCFLFGANDDCIELDGGQQNVRFFGNRCEEALMGVSVQMNMTSPSYVFGNVFTGLGTEFGHKVSAIKTSSVDSYHYGAVSYFFHNTFCGPGSDCGALDLISNWETARLRTFNNLFVGKAQRLLHADKVKNGRLGGNVVTDDETALMSVAHANASPVEPSPAEPIVNFSRHLAGGKAVVGAVRPGVKAVTLPERPVPWALDVGRLEVKVAKGVAMPASPSFKLACGGKGYRRHFKVRTTEHDTGWFDVSPKEGVVESGKTIAFTVAFRPERMNRRHRYAAAFLVRTDDGFARPVSLHAETDYVAPYEIENPRGKIFYGTRGEGTTWTFELPHPGKWYLYFRGRHPNAALGNQEEYLTDVTPFVNGQRIRDISIPAENWTSWVPLDPGEEGMVGYQLKAGAQAVKLTGFDKDLVIEGLLFASNPMDVEDDKRETPTATGN